jgi:hypothetical protein
MISQVDCYMNLKMTGYKGINIFKSIKFTFEQWINEMLS